MQKYLLNICTSMTNPDGDPQLYFQGLHGHVFFYGCPVFFVLRISPKKTSIPNFCITIEGTIQIFSRRDVGGRRPP